MTSENHTSGQRRMGRWMLLFSWLGLLILLTLGFQAVLDRQYNPNTDPRIMTTQDGRSEVVLQRNRQGHYVASGSINGQSAVFLLDTGATRVAVPEHLADRYGLQKGVPGISQTANGRVQVWSTRIDRVTLGGIELHDVRASILPNMRGDEVLLGMSFLKHVELIQRGDQLTLRQ